MFEVSNREVSFIYTRGTAAGAAAASAAAALCVSPGTKEEILSENII